MRITREFGFDMGHMLPDHGGACYRPHGHRYRFEVTLDGDLHGGGSSKGMVLDYADLKAEVERHIIEVFDHRFAVASYDHRLGGLREVFRDDELVVLAYPPTAEHLVTLIAAILKAELTGVVEVRLWETPTCSATWVRP